MWSIARNVHNLGLVVAYSTFQEGEAKETGRCLSQNFDRRSESVSQNVTYHVGFCINQNGRLLRQFNRYRCRGPVMVFLGYSFPTVGICLPMLTV